MLLVALHWTPDYGTVKLEEFLFRGVVFGWSAIMGLTSHDAFSSVQISFNSSAEMLDEVMDVPTIN